MTPPMPMGYTHERPPQVGRLDLHQRQPVAVGLAGLAFIDDFFTVAHFDGDTHRVTSSVLPHRKVTRSYEFNRFLVALFAGFGPSPIVGNRAQNKATLEISKVALFRFIGGEPEQNTAPTRKLLQGSSGSPMVTQRGLEPRTFALKGRCSTN